MFSTSETTTTSPQEQSKKCFLEWMDLQQEDLTELLQALKKPNEENSETGLNRLKEKSIQRFQNYMDQRLELAKKDVSSYFAPRWISNLENSLLWIAGCRPSMLVRLLYAHCGSEVEKNLLEFIQHGVKTDSLGGLSLGQLNLVNELHLNTVKEEDKLTSKFASLQEDVADQPISMIAKCLNEETCPLMKEQVKRALEDHGKSMLNVLHEADTLRLSTLKELLGILTPVQAVDFLAAGKQLHLCLYQWGKRMHDVQS